MPSSRANRLCDNPIFSRVAAMRLCQAVFCARRKDFGLIARRVKPSFPSARTSQTFAGIAAPRAILSLAAMISFMLQGFIIYEDHPPQLYSIGA
jgi:hypothetical protein